MHDLVPQRDGVVGVGQQLHPALARVAGAAHQDGVPAQHAPRRVHAGRQGRVGHGLHDLAGAGTLDREHRVAVVGVDDLGSFGALGMMAEPRKVLVVIGRIGHRQVVVGGKAVGEQVVQDPAALVAQQRILGAAHGEGVDVVGQQALEQVARAGAAGLDLAHVGDVEDAGGAPYGEVLGADALRVLHRHLPSGEGHELRPGRLVTVEKGGASEGAGGGRHRGHATARAEVLWPGRAP